MANTNILSKKLYEVLHAKPTDGQTEGPTDERADGKNVYNNVFFNKDNDDA